jgi:hypothetical protein
VKQLLSFLIIIFVAACSSSEEIGKEKEKEDDIYIFDEVPSEDTYKFEKPNEKINLLYVIQIGAFSTRERAELFAEKSQNDLNRGVAISYNDDMNLFVARLEEIFSSKIEAERVRAKLWQMEEYNDAWIKSLEENPDRNLK